MMSLPRSRISIGSLRRLMMTALLAVAGCFTSVSDPSKPASSAGAVIERTTEKGPVKLIVRVSPQQPRLSDLVEVDAQVIAPPGVEIKPPTFGRATGDFLVRGYSEPKGEPSSKSSTSDSMTQRFRYQLEPVSSGRHLIRSLTIEFVDNRSTSEQKGAKSSIESEPIEVNVISELGDQVPSLSDLEPMVPPRSVEQSSLMIRLLVAIGLALIVAAVVWVFWKKKTAELPPPPPTPREIAHAAFLSLLAENLPGRGQFKEFYVRLTGIVRCFIEGTTGLRAPEQTTEEFLVAMRSQNIFSPGESVRLQEFLEAADMVKYAGQKPDTTQIELSIARAKEFVDFLETPAVVPDNDSRIPQKV